MKTADFDYFLPEEQIAQKPWPIRDKCRLLAMDRAKGSLYDGIFRDVYDYLKPHDILIANETRVMPARLLGKKLGGGGRAEVFLLREAFGYPAATSASADTSIASFGDASSEARRGTRTTNEQQAHSFSTGKSTGNTSALWEALVRPGKRLKPGVVVEFQNTEGLSVLQAEVIDWIPKGEKGERLVRLSTSVFPSLDEALHAVGHLPLPPYIKNYAGDKELYQTVFSHQEKSAAAPTAGLHFTPELIEEIKAKGVSFETVELEVGLDTFRIVDEDDPTDHRIHTEFYTVSQSTVDAIEKARIRGGRVIAVGTTSVRSLESAWSTKDGKLKARKREATSLYILPGYQFQVVDALITNFHVPRSTLMMLVSAFASRDSIMAAYRHALDQNYRFLSFGDAMLII